MHGAFPGVKGPFTPSQWIELEHQALIYKYISLNVPVPPNLLIPIRKSVQSFGMPYSATGSFSPNSCKLLLSEKLYALSFFVPNSCKVLLFEMLYTLCCYCYSLSSLILFYVWCLGLCAPVNFLEAILLQSTGDSELAVITFGFCRKHKVFC